MHEYYFKIRKADMEFEFSTTDKLTFEEQISDWITRISKIGSEKSEEKPTPNKPFIKETSVDTNKQPSEPMTISADDDELIYDLLDDKEEKPFIAEQTIKKEEESSNVRAESFIKEQPQTVIQQEEVDFTERNDFIDVKKMTSIKEIQTPVFKEENSIIDAAAQDFEKTLEESMTNPKTSVIEKKDKPDNFKDYLESFNPKTPIDNLVVTASYILNQENQERFSIKQLNAKLIPIGQKPVDHSVINEAITQNLIRIIPDLTGMNEVTEYTLTEEGEGYFVE